MKWSAIIGAILGALIAGAIAAPFTIWSFYEAPPEGPTIGQYLGFALGELLAGLAGALPGALIGLSIGWTIQRRRFGRLLISVLAGFILGIVGAMALAFVVVFFEFAVNAEETGGKVHCAGLALGSVVGIIRVVKKN